MKIKATIEIESNFSEAELAELALVYPKGLPDDEIKRMKSDITNEIVGLFSDDDTVKIEIDVEE
ncbi:hypothetical protein [Bacillus altitudinis]|uniref:hypothetical protein n=1 Tax=Bacillus altitudinis TaxID=293387 RepID=UPI00210137B2|nr:hypothetical protein [Bacillus altitudinis]UTV34828.1 hypothetical protein NM966_19740 [Bacillus altitudinis]